MGDVYREAERVVVWLGAEADDSDIAMDALTYTASQVIPTSSNADKASSTVTFVEGGDPSFINSNDDTPFSARQWRAIAKLFCRGWFTRLWVRQEIVMASPTTIVQVGNKEMIWCQFVKATDSIYVLRVSKYAFVFEASAVEDFRKKLDISTSIAWLTGNANILDLVRSVKDCKCLDDRDRVYALLALTTRDIREVTKPNYTQTAKEVYRSLMIQYTRSTGRLNMLTLCDSATQPSWVPDWDKLSNLSTSAIFSSAASNSRCVFKELNSSSIEVYSVKCDEVATFLSNISVQSSTTEVKATTIDIIKRYLGSSPPQWKHERSKMAINTLLRMVH